MTDKKKPQPKLRPFVPTPTKEESISGGMTEREAMQRVLALRRRMLEEQK